MRIDGVLSSVKEYYTNKVIANGATPAGVDWNSSKSQKLRFDQLLKVCDNASAFSINDYGCGYGALLDHVLEKKLKFIRYSGFDISKAMISKATGSHKDIKNCVFFDKKSFLKLADYTVASGIFNVKLGATDERWRKHVLSSLKSIAVLSKKGFSFNILTKYSEREFMRDYLYYADPCFYFDYCKRNFSKSVSLLHDYGLYEFTVIVRKDR